ncbi:MAG: Ralstonia phage [Pseudomonadota bacterium]|jgi:quercetin dioxygenase-like cupin family protein
MRLKYGPGVFPVAPAVPMRARVEALQAAMVQLPPVDCPIRHHFADGLYAREMSVPAGAVVVGAVHKTSHLILVTKGRLQIVTPDGTREVSAGDVIQCAAGMKNAMVALEDSKWVNLLSNPGNETDTDLLVEVFTESTAAELLRGKANKQLMAQADFKKVEA